MKTKHWIITVALLALSGTAYANESEYMRPAANANPASPKTRTQVTEELKQAQAQGLTNVREDEYPIIQQTSPHKTRAQVLAELRDAQAHGLTNSRDDVYPIILKSGSARSRAEVRAEAIEAVRNEHGNSAGQGIYFGG